MMAITLTNLLNILLYGLVLAIIYYVAAMFIGGIILQILVLILVIVFIMVILRELGIAV
jgi:hypothetical protein